jgi:diguanylate cyclase (GGDEF)-like protein
MKTQNRKSSQYERDDTLRYILDVIKEGVWNWDVNTGNVERSPGWYRMLYYDVGVFPNTVFTWENIIHPDDYPLVMRHFEDYICGRIESYEIEYRCRKADGDYLWIQDQGKIVERNDDGSVARMIGAHLNIHERKLAQLALQRQNELLREDKFTLENLVEQRTSELEEANRKLEQYIKKIDHLRNTDSLTSINNRHKLETELHHEIARAKRYRAPLSVALFDIDQFKKINDSYGHQVGDLILQQVSQLTLRSIRETDIIGRWGGDEYLIILPGVDMVHAVASVEKIRCLIAESEFTKSLRVTCSFGVTQYILDDSIGSMYKRTDVALYRAKHAGRNAVASC